ncbi:MAG: hemerythrin domain-containing protein [Bryobacteraceae bacterium]|nr:hemerythrin domain-containing protein [Bryobacteraceae bacterium]
MGTQTVFTDGAAAAANADWGAAPVEHLIGHILKTHHAFLREQLPRIEGMFDRILGKRPDEICGFVPTLANTFFGLKAELESHLMKEEMILFPHIVRLARAREAGEETPRAGFGSVRGPIAVMEHEHESGNQALEQMRRLTDGYAMKNSSCPNRRELFQALSELDADLVEHIRLENEILHPRAIRLEAGA